MARPDAVQGNRPFFDLDALRFGLVFGQANPGHFGVGVGDAGDDSCVEGGAGQLLVALQLARYYFCSYVCFMHGLVRQHGLAHDVADGENMGHISALLDVYVDEATVCDGDAGFVSGNLFAVGGTAYGLQDQVVYLLLGAL